MKKIYFLSLILIFPFFLNAQNTVITDDDSYPGHNSAMLDVYSLSKGLLVPRLTSTQRITIFSPAEGLLVYDTDLDQYYFFGNAKWNPINSPSLWSENSDTVFISGEGKRYGVGTASPLARLTVQGDASIAPDEPLFEVKNSVGDVIFAVYENEVKVNFKQTAKGVKGGFAVGGLTGTKADPVEYMRVTQDSVRIYIDDTGAKGVKGGFAVGGLTGTKGISNNYFLINEDSARIYLKDPVNTKGVKGGFAVGGLTGTKGSKQKYLTIERDSARIYIDQNAKGVKGGFAVGGLSGTKGGDNYLNLTIDNYFIGHQGGSNIVDGIYNSILGYQSGVNLTGGSSNSFLGYQSGFNTTIGSGNLFLGYQSGYTNIAGNYNTFLGYQSGQLNVDGKNNTFLGSFSGGNNINGSYNTFVGDSTGYNNTVGNNNTFLGTRVGYNNTNGFANLFLGNFAGFSNQGGYENIFLGDHSGFANLNSGLNVAIGVRSGYYGESGWNNVYIGTETGYSNIDGEGNVFIGYQTGMNNTNGTRNIFIGNMAGLDQQGSDKLIIDNRNEDSTKTFIWGDLLGGILRFNAKVGIGTYSHYYNLAIYNSSDPAIVSIMGVGNAYDYATLKLEADIGTDTLSYMMVHDKDNRYRVIYNDGDNLFSRLSIDTLGQVTIGDWVDGTELLDVNGNARFRAVASAAYGYDLNITTDGVLTTSSSDKRLKENFRELSSSLDKVLRLKGFSFDWRSGRKNDIGMIAQEVQKVLPEVVFENPTDGMLGINYSRFPALFVEAFKEQQLIIKTQQTEIEDLKNRLENIEKLLNR